MKVWQLCKSERHIEGVNASCSVEEKPGGWLDVTVATQPGALAQQKALQTSSVVILTSSRPPSRGALDWLARQGCSPSQPTFALCFADDSHEHLLPKALDGGI